MRIVRRRRLLAPGSPSKRRNDLVLVNVQTGGDSGGQCGVIPERHLEDHRRDEKRRYRSQEHWYETLITSLRSIEAGGCKRSGAEDHRHLGQIRRNRCSSKCTHPKRASPERCHDQRRTTTPEEGLRRLGFNVGVAQDEDEGRVSRAEAWRSAISLESAGAECSIVPGLEIQHIAETCANFTTKERGKPRAEPHFVNSGASKRMTQG